MAMVEFTEKDESLVKESWEIMKLDLPHYSLRFFTTVLEIAPEAKGMFSFMKDSDELPHNNLMLKAHALKVFKMMCEAVVQLREKGEVVVGDTTLDHLGSVHQTLGVVDAHFQVVREALLRTVQEAVGEDKCSAEMKCAWGVAYDHLATAIKAHMNNNNVDTA